MSGAGLVGAQPKVDIVTTDVIPDPNTHTVKRKSDVGVDVPVDPGKNFTIGIMVTNQQAATATLTIVNPPSMAVVKEALNGPESTKLKQAFTPLAGHRWVAFTGTTAPAASPGSPPPPSMSLQTELTVNSSQIVKHGFQVIPVVAHYSSDDWTAQHYLIGASIIPGHQQTAVLMRGQRGYGQASARAKSSKKKSRRKR